MNGICTTQRRCHSRTRIPPRITPPRPRLAEAALALCLVPLVIAVLAALAVLWPFARRVPVLTERVCRWCGEPIWNCDCIDVGEPVGRDA